MLIGAGDPWHSSENKDRLYSMSLAAFIISEKSSKKPYILSSASNIDHFSKKDSVKYEEYSKVLQDTLMELGIEEDHIIARDKAFNTHIELRLLRPLLRMYIKSINKEEGVIPNIQIIAFHNKTRVEKLLKFLNSEGRGLDGNISVNTPDEIFKKFDPNLEYRDIMNNPKEDIFSEKRYSKYDGIERVFNVFGKFSPLYPNNRAYLASKARKVSVPYKWSVDTVVSGSKKSQAKKKSLDIFYKLLKSFLGD